MSSAVINGRKRPRVLLVLDFDDTIVEGNSEESIKLLLDKTTTSLPEELVCHYETHKNWNLYINLLYQFLHQKADISQHDFIQSLRSTTFVPGSRSLLEKIRELKKNRPLDAIIISGGNVLIIEEILSYSGLLSGVIDKVISNPAHFDDCGLLRVGLLNSHSCNHCFSGELCKGLEIRNFLACQAKAGVQYERTFFCGDYLNDVCLTLELSQGDVVLARKDFPLEEDLRPRVATGELKATLMTWTTGHDVIKVIDKYLESL